MSKYKISKREKKILALTNLKAISVCLGGGGKLGRSLDQTIKNCNFLINQKVDGDVLKPWIKGLNRDLKNSHLTKTKVVEKIKALENRVLNLTPWDKISPKRRGEVDLAEISKISATELLNKKRDKEKLLNSLKAFKNLAYTGKAKIAATNPATNPPSPA